MHVGNDARREAEIAEDDVLDAFVVVRLAAGPDLGRLLTDQVEDHGQVVDAERPERVLVLADLSEVLTVPVQVEDVAQLAALDQLLQLHDRGVVEQEVSREEDEAALLGERDELVRLRGGERRRLLDEDVLAGLERLARELVVRRHRGGDDDGLKGVVLEQILEPARRAGARVSGSELVEQVSGEVAEPGQLGEVVEVAGEVRAPVAEAGEADPHQSFQTFSLVLPL